MSNYLDLSQLQRYWNKERINHHTEATSMIYALHEGLRMLLNEGLDAAYQRHLTNEGALVAGLEAMGLSIYGEKATKMPTVTPILFQKVLMAKLSEKRCFTPLV